jgi:hypothetical protein
VIRDDTDDMVNHVIYHYFLVADRGEAYEIPLELTEDEQLAVAVLISQEEERRTFPGYEDALALSVASPPLPRPPLMQPPCTPPPRPRRRGQGGALGPMAMECACLAGGHASADPGLGSRDAGSTARTSTAANGGLAVGAAAIHRPLRR